MSEENNTRPKTAQNRQSKFRFLNPDEKQTLRKTDDEFNGDNKNITFDSNVDLTVQFESKGYDTQRYNIKKLVNERLYETQVFDISRISEAILETINEIEEKGAESFKDLEVVDDFEFENNENYNRSLNILVSEVERKQYTEHVEIDEETFKEQSQIIKSELEKILRNNSVNDSYDNVGDEVTETENNDDIGSGFGILLAENSRLLEDNVNSEILETPEHRKASEDLLQLISDIYDKDIAEEVVEKSRFMDSTEIKDGIIDTVEQQEINQEINQEEQQYISFDQKDFNDLDDDNFSSVELKLLTDEELGALSEREYLTQKPVVTKKSTNYVNKLSFDEEKRLQASKFFNDKFEQLDDDKENDDINNKMLTYVGIGVIGIIVCAIIFFTARIVINIYESNNVEYEFEQVQVDETAIPVLDGIESDYSATIEIVSNNAISNVKEISNVHFVYDEVSSDLDYFDEFVYADLNNIENNQVVLYGKDDNNHFGSIKYLGDEDFFNTLRVYYTVDGVETEYSVICYYKTNELDENIGKKTTLEGFKQFLENEFAKSEHSNGVAITNESSILTLVTYDTQEQVYHVAYLLSE